MSGNRPDRIAVGIPVRDEAERLPRLLNALARQKRGQVPLTVCFLLDGCRDESESLLRRRASWLPFDVVIGCLPHHATPNAGRARRAAMKLCQDATRGETAFLLSTDADSAPDPDWIETSCAALERVDIVAGHIRRNRGTPNCWRTRLEDYLAALHTFRREVDPIVYDPLPSHPSLGGASLGFRSEVYGALDGFPGFAQGEARAIVARARREGYRVRHDPAVRVCTSSRTVGRAPRGLADQLREQLKDAAPPLVPDPVVLARHYHRQATLRRSFEEGHQALISAARQLGYCETHLLQTAGEVHSSDAFVEIIAPDNCLSSAHVLPLPVAEANLATLRKLAARVEAA